MTAPRCDIISPIVRYRRDKSTSWFADIVFFFAIFPFLHAQFLDVQAVSLRAYEGT